MNNRPHLLLLLPPVLSLFAGCASFEPSRPAPPVAKRVAVVVTPAPPVVTAPAPVPVAPPAPAVPVVSAAVTPPVKDIWARLRTGFELPRDRPEVRVWAKRLAEENKRTNLILQRSEPYLCHVVNAIDERRMPLDLALLPAIESAFDPQAYSRNAAMGLWQFLPYTGSRFGLRQNWWYDGRRDVPEATRAALDYLDYLHAMFGDWLITIAAYNTGEGRMKKAIEEAKSKGGKTDFWSLSLPAETRDYVPKLLGMIELIDRPELYGYKLTPMPNAPRIETVELPGQIELGLAADMVGLKLDELKKLNPGFRRWATAPDGPHRLVVPYGRGDALRKDLAQLPRDKFVHWDSHTVRQGENLKIIGKNYDVDPLVLGQVNRLNNRSLKAGTELRIPRSGRRPAENRTPYTTLMPGLALITKRDSTERTALKRPARPDPSKILYYTVRIGDSLSVIATRFRVSVHDLMQWNSLHGPHRIRAGQTLKVFASKEEGIAGTGT